MSRWIYVVFLAGAALAGESSDNCATNVAKKIPAGTEVIVFLDDSSKVTGVFPGFVTSETVLYIRDQSGLSGQSRTIPFAQIEKITFEKPGSGPLVLTFLGVGVGVALGYAIGVTVAPPSEGFLDFNEFAVGSICAVFGGIVGGAMGAKVGKDMRVTVTFRCP